MSCVLTTIKMHIFRLNSNRPPKTNRRFIKAFCGLDFDSRSRCIPWFIFHYILEFSNFIHTIFVSAKSLHHFRFVDSPFARSRSHTSIEVDLDI